MAALSERLSVDGRISVAMSMHTSLLGRLTSAVGFVFLLSLGRRKLIVFLSGGHGYERGVQSWSEARGDRRGT